MKNKRVLITGGAGLVGSHIAELVAAQSPREILVLDNFVSGSRGNLKPAGAIYPVTIVSGDTLDTKLLARVMKGIDIVFHLAAPGIAKCVENPRHAFDVLIRGTSNVLQAAAAARVAKVVWACSASKLALVDQCSALAAVHFDNIAAVKQTAESFNKMHGLHYVTLRYSTVCEPQMITHSAEVLIRWTQSIARELRTVAGDGPQTIDSIDVRDLALANLLAAASDVGQDVFDIESGIETNLNLLAERLATAMGAGEGHAHSALHTVNAASGFRVDTSRTTKRLGSSADMDLMAGLRSLVESWPAEQYRPLARVASR